MTVDQIYSGATDLGLWRGHLLPLQLTKELLDALTDNLRDCQVVIFGVRLDFVVVVSRNAQGERRGFWFHFETPFV